MKFKQDQTDETNSLIPPCCGSGCTVCVLDYWEDLNPAASSEDEHDSDLLELLEAIEHAGECARQMIAGEDGDAH